MNIADNQLMQLFNSWYYEIRRQNLVKSQHFKQDIESKIHRVKEDQIANLYYSLLEYRHKLLVGDFSATLNIKPDLQGISNPLIYYFWFFQAIHMTYTGHYRLALQYFKKAKKYLCLDEKERAEFSYQLSIYYCATKQPLFARLHVLQAKRTFDEWQEYQVNSIDCENILGLACVLLEQFNQAQEHFITALNAARKLQVKMLTERIRYSLGLLFAEQGFSQVAIRHLNQAYENELKDPKTIYLLARENYQLGKEEAARELIKKGIKICNNLNDNEYIHHLLILNEMHNHSSVSEMEPVIEAGITYFKGEELTQHVSDYAQYLAKRFLKSGNNSKASHYYDMAAQQARQQLKKTVL